MPPRGLAPTGLDNFRRLHPKVNPPRLVTSGILYTTPEALPPRPFPRTISSLGLPPVNADPRILPQGPYLHCLGYHAWTHGTSTILAATAVQS